MRFASYLIAALALLLPSLASASTPCTDDIKRLCADVERGEGRIGKCLRENQAEVKDTCKAFRKKAARMKGKRAAACKDDVAKFCKDVARGERRIAQCLTENKASLSEGCAAHVPGKRRKMKRRAFRKVCGADIREHCEGVKPGKGRILACLRGQKGAVSARCVELL